MAKRTATRDINHENWDQEDEPEEAGTFQRAPEEQLKNRVIKTAKRRNLSSQGVNEDDSVVSRVACNCNSRVKVKRPELSAHSQVLESRRLLPRQHSAFCRIYPKAVNHQKRTAYQLQIIRPCLKRQTLQLRRLQRKIAI